MLTSPPVHFTITSFPLGRREDQAFTEMPSSWLRRGGWRRSTCEIQFIILDYHQHVMLRVVSQGVSSHFRISCTVCLQAIPTESYHHNQIHYNHQHRYHHWRHTSSFARREAKWYCPRIKVKSCVTATTVDGPQLCMLTDVIDVCFMNAIFCAFGQTHTNNHWTMALTHRSLPIFSFDDWCALLWEWGTHIQASLISRLWYEGTQLV